MVKTCHVKKLHYNDLAEFLSSFENTPKIESLDFWYSRFSLWWDNNPAFDKNFVRGEILIVKGKIEGFQGFIPSFFQLSRKKLTVYNSTTWRVSPKYRGVDSLRLLRNQLKISENSIYFSTSPLPQLVNMNKRLGLEPIFKREKLKTYYIFTNLRNILNKKLSHNNLLKILVKIFYPLIAIYEVLISFSIKLTPQSYYIKLVERADHTFDQLWEETRERFENTNIRTSDIINWYCSNDGMGNNLLFGCYNNNDLIGYMLCMSEETRSNLRLLTVLDLWGKFENENMATSLLNHSLKFGLYNNYDLVLLPVFHRVVESFSKKFILNRPSSGTYFYKAKSSIVKKLSNSESYFSSLQGDWGLF